MQGRRNPAGVDGKHIRRFEQFHFFRAQLDKSLTSAEQVWQQLDLLGGCLENRWQEDAGVSVEDISVARLFS